MTALGCVALLVFLAALTVLLGIWFVGVVFHVVLPLALR